MTERTAMTGLGNTLRRRFGLIAATVVAGAALGAGTSYLIRRFAPLYRAEAVVGVTSPDRQGGDYEHRVRLAEAVKSRSMMQMMVDPVMGRNIRETRWFRDTLHGNEKKAIDCLGTCLDAVAQPQAPSIAVAMTAGSPKEAALIATEAARLFVQQQTTPPPKDESGARLAPLTRQRDEIERDLSDQEAALQALRRNARAKGIADLDAASTALHLNDLERQESSQALEIKQLEGEVESLKRASQNPTAAVDQTVAQDPLVISLGQQEAALEVQLSGQLTRFGEDHRVVRQTKDQIDEVQAALKQRKAQIAEQAKQASLATVGDKLRARQERLEQLRQLQEQTQQRLATGRSLVSQYEQMREKHDERTEALRQVKSQMESLAAAPQAPAAVQLQLLRPAAEPTAMVWSRRESLWVSGGAVLGLLAAIITLFLIERLDDVVRTSSDVRRFLNLPLLGIIPDAREDRAVCDIDPYHIARDAPYSLLGEAYRRCRTNLDVSERAALKTLLIASGDAGDGKTSLACNLATAFAAKHENVLVIDANLRQPSLHLAFGRTGSPENGDERRMGLTSILTGQCDYQAAIRTSRTPGLDLVYAGPPTANPAELLAGRRMKDFIENVAKWYDHVIIDSPPVLLVSDVKVLAGLVDGTVLVFNAATTHRGAAQRTIDELHDVGGKVIGCVLFDVPALKGGYFRRQFRAYRNYVRPQLAANSA